MHILFVYAFQHQANLNSIFFLFKTLSGYKKWMEQNNLMRERKGILFSPINSLTKLVPHLILSHFEMTALPIDAYFC